MISTPKYVVAALLVLGACDGGSPPVPPEAPAAPSDPLSALRALEDELRTLDFAALPPPERATGANPIDVIAVGEHLVGALAGDDAVVLLDGRGRELGRLPGPRTPRALALIGDAVLAAGAGPVLHRYRIVDGALTADGTVKVPAVTVSGLASHSSGTIYVADGFDGVLRAVLPGGDAIDVAGCRGPNRVTTTASAVIASCLLDRSVIIAAVGPDGRPRGEPVHIFHEGQPWSVAAVGDGDGVLLAIGGAEDHALDRTDGFFGYIDSYVFLYRVIGGAAERVGEVNLSASGVVMPKWLTVRRNGDAIVVDTAGFGSNVRAQVTFAAGGDVSVTRTSLPPGTRAAASAGGALVAANPLLDAWVVVADTVEVVAVPARLAAEPSRDVRMGELLFFTTLLAPGGTSEGAHSRFTCETCHFEGYGDGRTHYTGRDDVHATTRPLRALAQSRPYFSRANDRSMTDMVHAEFRVANRGTGSSSWFAIDRALVPWLAQVPGAPEAMSPVELRAAFMRHLAVLTHEVNPAVAERRGFTETERRGAAIFRDRCESCHQARTLVDEPASRVAFADWERHVMSPQGALTWARGDRLKTGIVPYVHAEGSRVPSLRRLYRKYPYFTNGSAPTLTDVLARVRVGTHDGEFNHAGAAGAHGKPLPDEERAPLLAFLRIL